MLGSILWIDGRNSRMKWWLTHLGITILLLSAMALLFGFSATDLHDMKAAPGFMLVRLLASVLAYLAIGVLCCWISIINDVRRLHDLNKSGWWSLLYFAPVLILGFLLKIYGRDIGSSSAPIGLLIFLLFAASMWRLVELGFFSGDAGDNDFGPPSGLSGTIDLDDEIEGLIKASGRAVPEAPRALAPAPVQVQPLRYASAQPQATGFGKRR